MNNPFEIIESRLNSIENLLLDIKHNPLNKGDPLTKQVEQPLIVHEAAKFLNLSVATIYSKVSRNELPVMKRGKRLYFSRTELMEYLKEGHKKSNSEIQAAADNYVSKKNG